MIGDIKPFNTIGRYELHNVQHAMKTGLSGYLAGKERGGLWVQALEEKWCETFHVKHAIACNSATSGLLAACVVADVGPGKVVSTTPFMMSATAAAPAFLGADIAFSDIEPETFSYSEPLWGSPVAATIVTNLFGHPAELHRIRQECETFDRIMIEDNAQSPFAMENGRYTGTIGHMGVWSLNIHKPIQCGEGGMVTTNDDSFARSLRNFINHGENAGDRIGLNLRMPEICAAIALSQLERGDDIIHGRIKQALNLLKHIGNIDGLRSPPIKYGFRNVFYTIPFVIERNRAKFCKVLTELGVPVVEGYVEPLYRLPAFKKFARSCPVAESMQDEKLFYIENCAYDFTGDQIEQIGEAFRFAAETCL